MFKCIHQSDAPSIPKCQSNSAGPWTYPDENLILQKIKLHNEPNPMGENQTKKWEKKSGIDKQEERKWRTNGREGEADRRGRGETCSHTRRNQKATPTSSMAGLVIWTLITLYYVGMLLCPSQYSSFTALQRQRTKDKDSCNFYWYRLRALTKMEGGTRTWCNYRIYKTNCH